MGKFQPKIVECILSSDSYRYNCKVTHNNEFGHTIQNTYRFQGKPMTHLIKNEEDYNELISNPNFIDHVVLSEKPESELSETPKEKKMRERKEVKEARRALKEKKVKENKEKENTPEENVETSEAKEEEESPGDADSEPEETPEPN